MPADGALAQGGERQSSSGLVLGMRIESLTDAEREELAVDHGVRVVEVREGPALEAGIRDGDVLLRIRGERIEDVAQLRRIAGDLPKDRSVPVLVKRESRSLFLALNPAAKDDG